MRDAHLKMGSECRFWTISHRFRLPNGCVAGLSGRLRRFSSEISLTSRAQYHDQMLRCAQAGDAARAERWFAKMQLEGFEADLQAYNILLSAHAAHGHLERVEELLACLERPDGYSFSSVLRCCERSGAVAKAERHFGRMLELGVPLTEVVCNAKIAVHAAAGDLKGGTTTHKMT